MTIQSKPGEETFGMVINPEAQEITILRCGQVFMRFQPTPETWARLATVGMIITGREGRKALASLAE